RPWPGRRPAAGRRMHRLCSGLRLSPDDAVDPEHPGRRPQDLSGCRLQPGQERAAPQLWPEPDRRDLGARVMTFVTGDLIALYKRRATRLRAEACRSTWRSLWALLAG